MIICDKLRKLFHIEEKPHVHEGYWNEPLTYLGISFNEIKKDSIIANKKMGDNIEKLVKKLPKLTKEELKNELKAVRKSMNSKEYGMIKTLFPQDFFQLIVGHLKSYIKEIEKELKKYQ